VLRQQEGYVGTPIVYLSTEEGIEEQIDAINAGGDEFLTKPIAPRHLVAAVAARARRGRVLATRIAYDGLTGLLNHSHLKQQVEIELSRAARERWEVAYAMIDLDRFKSINDAFGHAAGDRLLKSLARLLRQRLRSSDGGRNRVVLRE
jgi:PleD family two-component response regulator